MFRGHIGSIMLDAADYYMMLGIGIIVIVKGTDFWLKEGTAKLIFENGWDTTFSEWETAGGYAIMKGGVIEAWGFKEDWLYGKTYIFPQTALLGAHIGRSMKIKISFSPTAFDDLPDIVKGKILQNNYKEPFMLGMLSEEQIAETYMIEDEDGNRKNLEGSFLLTQFKLLNRENTRLIERIKALNSFIEETREWIMRVHPEKQSILKRAWNLVTQEKSEREEMREL